MQSSKGRKSIYNAWKKKGWCIYVWFLKLNNLDQELEAKTVYVIENLLQL